MGVEKYGCSSISSIFGLLCGVTRIIDLMRAISSGAEIKIILLNFSEKNILVFIWFKTSYGELPLKGAFNDQAALRIAVV